MLEYTFDVQAQQHEAEWGGGQHRLEGWPGSALAPVDPAAPLGHVGGRGQMGGCW